MPEPPFHRSLDRQADIRVVTTRRELRDALAPWRGPAERVGLVPTMGALHAGHLSLAALSRASATRTVVTIFVNPTQFAPGEDFAAYPRSLEGDLEKLRDAGVDLVFCPDPSEIYPDGFATSVQVGGPALAGLEDAVRPTHFAGVATVVAKLLSLVQPHVAVFGEKDFQQLAVIRRMARDLDLPVAIRGAPTVREPDGLALSSRNAYLSEDERRRAPALNLALRETALSIVGGAPISTALSAGRRLIEQAGFAVDYFELREAQALTPVSEARGALRLLAAARLGRTRLIDNVAVTMDAHEPAGVES